MKTPKIISAITLAGALLLTGGMSAEAKPQRVQRVCFPAYMEQRLTAAIPVVPGYCLVAHRASKPMEGTINRGSLTFKAGGKWAIVRIFRDHRQHTYTYRMDPRGWAF